MLHRSGLTSDRTRAAARPRREAAFPLSPRTAMGFKTSFGIASVLMLAAVDGFAPLARSGRCGSLQTARRSQYRAASTPLNSEPTASDAEAEVEGDGVNGAVETPSVLQFTRTKYFFGRVQIDLGPEYKPLDQVLDPSYEDDNSALATVQMPLPMGMVIEESATLPGKVEVVEVTAGSNAEKAGVVVGDVLRGCTAMAVNIDKAAEEDVAFNALAGAAKPGLQRAFYVADEMPFDETMKALTSNAEENGGPGFSNLVFERHFAG